MEGLPRPGSNLPSISGEEVAGVSRAWVEEGLMEGGESWPVEDEDVELCLVGGVLDTDEAEVEADGDLVSEGGVTWKASFKEPPIFSLEESLRRGF